MRRCEGLLLGEFVVRGQLGQLAGLVGRDGAGPDGAPQGWVAGFEVEHVADQEGCRGDRDALDRGDLQGQELADQAAAVGAEPDGSFADHVVFVGGGPGVLGGEFGDRPHFVGVGLSAEFHCVSEAFHSGALERRRCDDHVFDYSLN